MTAATTSLERPVSFVRAAKKLAAIRGDYGRPGGWIYRRNGVRICQGWDAYGQIMFKRGLLAQDDSHDAGNGKWYVWVIGLDREELSAAERLFGENA